MSAALDVRSIEQAEPEAVQRGTRRWAALGLVCFGALMIVLDGTIVNIALPSIQRDLGFSQSSLAWVMNAYVLTFGGFLLLGGRAADLVGRRAVFVAGLAIFTAASLVFRVRIYRSAAVSMIVVLLVSYAFYAFLQTYIDRPVIAGDDLFSRMIRDIYASDQPYNDFPSLHASLSTIFAIHCLRFDRRLGLLIATWAALIVVSTVFVKQHYVPDVVAGVLLAWVTSWWWLRRLAGSASA